MNRMQTNQALLLWVAFSLLPGCVAPQAQPFDSYRTAVSTLSDGAEKAIALEADASKAKFIIRVVASDRPGAMLSDRIRLDLSKPSTSFDFSPPTTPEVFLQAAAAGRALEALNEGFLRHAQMLYELASSKVSSDEEIDAFASKINGSAKEFVDGVNLAKQALGGAEADRIAVPPRDLAIISAAASELLRQYLLKKQSDALVKAIDESSPSVKTYAESVQALVEVIAIGERTRYATAWTDEVTKPLSMSPSDADKRRIANRAIELTDLLTARLGTLRTLHDAYGQLPKAFANLKDAAGGKAASLKDVEILAADARRLVKRYESLRKANEVAP